MMTTIIAAVLLFGLLFAGMSIGVILSNKPVKGSCGGIGASGVDSGCEICGGERNRCSEEAGESSPQKAQQSSGFSRNS